MPGIKDGLKVGYARVSTSGQDLTAQRDALGRLGVAGDRVYVDHGLTGTTRDRPGLREAMAACRAGDELVVTKLDRLARSLPDARDILADLTDRGVALNLAGAVHDPADPVGRLLFNVLAMVAEFESDLIKLRTREGLAVAKAKGRLRGKQPKLTPRQEAHLVQLHAGGAHSPAELAELFKVGRSTVYRSLERARTASATASTANAAGDVAHGSGGSSSATTSSTTSSTSTRSAASTTAPSARMPTTATTATTWSTPPRSTLDELLEAVDWPESYRPPCPRCGQLTTGLREKRARRGREAVVVATAAPCGCHVDDHAAALQAGVHATT